MPKIGIVRGFGEGYVATGYIIKLIKALNRRFRSCIKYEEIPCGNYIDHGISLSYEVLENMKSFDCIFIGDVTSNSNPIDYTGRDIAFALSDNIEYTCVSGFGKHSDIDTVIASYFDGGNKMRETDKNIAGCTEERVCAAFTASNIVKHVSRDCENRRRRLAFVKDDDNEYCADMFYKAFENLVLPLSNFKFYKFAPKDICRDILCNPNEFDVIFASSSFSEAVLGVYEFIMKDNFAFYNRYKSEFSVYSVKSLQSNSECGDYVPSLCSYIIALCDMLMYEFNMEKEATQLRLAVNEAADKGANSEASEDFIKLVIDELQNSVTTKYSKNAPVSRYIK